MDLKEIVKTFEGNLTDADRRLVAVLLADPVASSYLPAQEVAERAGVHESTVGRFAQKLGFENYRDLKGALRSELLADIDTAAGRIRARLDRAAERSILEVLIESEIKALAAVPRQIDARQMTRAAEALRDARRIFLFGKGHAASLIELFARRLTRSGYLATSFAHIDWDGIDRISAMTRDDVLVAFAFRRPVERFGALLEHARNLGARIVLISDLTGINVRPRPDVLLAASRGTGGESQSLTVPMAICNALILELSRLDGGRSLAALETWDAMSSALLGAASGRNGKDGPNGDGRKGPRKT